MTMIEKVAQAICKVEETNKAVNFSPWQSYIPAARTAVEAMREPTEEMTFAPYGSHDLGGYADPIEAADNWRAMIDAALEERTSLAVPSQ